MAFAAATSHAPGLPGGDDVVGREPELAAIAELVAARGPRALVLEAPAGLGKTRLWKAGLAAAEAQGLRVLSCRPAGTEVQLAFAALGDLLARVVDGTLDALPGPQRRALEAALLLEDPDGPPPDARAIGLAVSGVLRAAAAEDSLLLAIDDLQWVDAPSARALEFALRRLEGEPVAVLACTRTGDGEPTAAFDLGAALGDDRTRRVTLGALPVRALGALIRDRLDVRLPPALVGRIHLVSGGNPLYALEIARVLDHANLDSPLALPSTLRELVSERLAALPPSTRALLLVAAASTQPTVGLLEEAAGDARDLRHALAGRVIELEGDRIRFTHPLMRSVLSAEASPAERRAVHRRLAAVIDEPEERARHLALGAEGPDGAAAAFVDGAAARAAARGAPDAAAEIAELALGLTPADRAEDAQRRRVRAAELRYVAGDTAAAVELLERALEAARPGGDRARILLRLGSVRGESESIATAVELYRRALAEAASDDALRAEIHQHLAFALQLVEVPAAAADAHAALELAERLGDPSLHARSLATSALIEFQLGRGVQRAALEEAIALEQVAGRLSLDHSPSLALAFQLQRAGELDAARTWFERLCDRAADEGDAARALPLVSLSYVELRAGNWDRAQSHADDAWQTAVESGRQVLEGAALCARARVAAWRGDVERARALADEAQAVAAATHYPRFTIDVQHLLGFLELSLGNARDAVAHLQPALDARRAQGIVEPNLYYFLPDAVEALVALGELAEAERVLEPFETQARALARPWALATAARCRGLVAAARDDLAAAADALNEARVRHSSVPEPFEAARTDLALGAVLRRAQRKAVARETLERARVTFERLGARLWVETAERELRRIGGRAAATTSLSETERRVAELVAAGRTNGEVAAALHVSAKTVEWNLTKVFRKLGVRSRVELAALAATP